MQVELRAMVAGLRPLRHAGWIGHSAAAKRIQRTTAGGGLDGLAVPWYRKRESSLPRENSADGFDLGKFVNAIFRVGVGVDSD
jgi:hypothetical protein